MSLFQVSDPRAGAGVLLQRLHQQGEKASALSDVEPHRPPGENLVPEQENEREEAEQRSPPVLLRKPPVVSREGVTVLDKWHQGLPLILVKSNRGLFCLLS